MLACDELAKGSLRNRDDRATGRTGRVAGNASRAEISGDPIASSEPAERQVWFPQNYGVWTDRPIVTGRTPRARWIGLVH